MPCGIGFKDSRLQQPKACIPARKTGFNFMQLESGNKDDERREYRHVHTLQVVAPRGLKDSRILRVAGHQMAMKMFWHSVADSVRVRATVLP